MAYPFHFYDGDLEISGDSFYCEYSRYENFSKWQSVSKRLLAENPDWTGVGKLVADTRLLIDSLSEDFRVDASRIGIVGHSLGGKNGFLYGMP